jgi:CelD/BcsL family acetyltransferase involved in cellulose biosynthesis
MNFILHKNFSGISPTDWNNLLSESITNTPFLRYEYLNTWWGTRGGGEWKQAKLVLISAYENNTLIGIAPLFLAEHNRKQSLMLLGSIEISDYLDLIVRQDDLSLFTSGLLDFLASNSTITFSCFDWYNLPDTSPTLATLKADVAKRGWLFTKETFRPSLYVPLPGDFKTYLASINKKQRHEIRRKMRRAEEYEKPIRWYIVEDVDTLDTEIDDFLALMANDHDKDLFLSEEMRIQMQCSMQTAFKAGWLQLAFLEVNGQKAAGYLSFDYDNRIWIYNSGLNFDFKYLSPGWVLLGYMLQWANENGRSEFDFMRGEEGYKYKFGAIKRDVIRLKVEV